MLGGASIQGLTRFLLTCLLQSTHENHEVVRKKDYNACFRKKNAVTFVKDIKADYIQGDYYIGIL